MERKILQPLHDRIVVKRLEEAEEKSGAIIIPDVAKEKPLQGDVVAVGAGRSDREGRKVPLDIKPGDRVLFGRHAGQEVEVDGDLFLILREDEVLARLKVEGNGQA